MTIHFVNRRHAYAPKLLKLFGFPTFRLWAYMMKVIPETRPTN